MKKFLPITTLALLLIVAAIWFAPAYAANPAVPLEHNGYHAPIGDLWRRSELYFGSQKPDGSAVSETEFEQFVDDVITPRFPDGLTLLTGYGQFRNSENMIVEEQSFVLILLYPRDDHEANREIEEIRTAYKDAFEQESVLRVDSVERVSF